MCKSFAYFRSRMGICLLSVNYRVSLSHIQCSQYHELYIIIASTVNKKGYADTLYRQVRNKTSWAKCFNIANMLVLHLKLLRQPGR